jgi:hypothetical protein
MTKKTERKSDCGCDWERIPDNKICRMTRVPSNFDIEEIMRLTNDPKFICRCCGRTANNSQNLCSPVKLK